MDLVSGSLKQERSVASIGDVSHKVFSIYI